MQPYTTLLGTTAYVPTDIGFQPVREPTEQSTPPVRKTRNYSRPWRTKCAATPAVHSRGSAMMRRQDSTPHAPSLPTDVTRMMPSIVVVPPLQGAPPFPPPAALHRVVKQDEPTSKLFSLGDVSSTPGVAVPHSLHPFWASSGTPQSVPQMSVPFSHPSAPSPLGLTETHAPQGPTMLNSNWNPITLPIPPPLATETSEAAAAAVPSVSFPVRNPTETATAPFWFPTEISPALVPPVGWAAAPTVGRPPPPIPSPSPPPIPTNTPPTVHSATASSLPPPGAAEPVGGNADVHVCTDDTHEEMLASGFVFCSQCGKRLRRGASVEFTPVDCPVQHEVDPIKAKERFCILCGTPLRRRHSSVVPLTSSAPKWEFPPRAAESANSATKERAAHTESFSTPAEGGDVCGHASGKVARDSVATSHEARYAMTPRAEEGLCYTNGVPGVCCGLPHCVLCGGSVNVVPSNAAVPSNVVAPTHPSLQERYAHKSERSRVVVVHNHYYS